MKILHFSGDQQLVAFSQEMFEEVFPEQNTFRILNFGHSPLTRLRAAPGLARMPSDYFSSRKYIEDFNNADILILHFMRREYTSAIMHAPAHLLVVWSAWGADYYPSIESKCGPILLPSTKRLMEESYPATRQTWLSRIRSTASFAFRRPSKASPTISDIAHRIDVLSAVTEVDADWIRTGFPSLRATPLHLHYASTEDTLAPGPENMEGSDILVGNSATWSSNHAESFELLKTLDLKHRRIVVPLGYGDPKVQQAVCKLGIRYFGKAFVPLTEHLPLDDYYREIAHCGTLLMNHVRQQALGNIIAALYKGARVLLRRENPIYLSYCKMGAVLSQIPNSGELSPDLLLPLDSESKLRNRNVVGEYWKRENVLANIRKLQGLAIQKQARAKP